MLSISNRYASGPSPCTGLSPAPWVVVTPPTTPASLPPLDPLLPKPAFSPEKGQAGSPVAVWLLGWVGLASEHVPSDGGLEDWVPLHSRCRDLPIVRSGFTGNLCSPAYSPPGILDRVCQPRLGHVSPSPLTG